MTVIDIPSGWAIVIVALLGVIASLITARFSRVRALERENRQLWFGLRMVVDALYRNGIPVPEEVNELIRNKE